MLPIGSSHQLLALAPPHSECSPVQGGAVSSLRGVATDRRLVMPDTAVDVGFMSGQEARDRG